MPRFSIAILLLIVISACVNKEENIFTESFQNYEYVVGSKMIDPEMEFMFDSIANVSVPKAIDFLDSYVKTESENIIETCEIYEFSAENLFSRNEFELAILQLEKSKKCNNNSPKFEMLKAKSYYYLGNENRCENHLMRASNLNHSFLYMLGNFYESRDDTVGAIRTYNKLYSVDTIYYSYCKQRILNIESGVKLLDSINWQHFNKMY